MKFRFRRIIYRLKNFYFIFTLIFVVWMAFFDSNDVYDQYLLHDKINQLEEEREFYKENIINLHKDIRELSTSPELLEKFAREKYLMKKPQEDIFVIVKDKE